MDSKTKNIMWKVVGGGIALIILALGFWIFSLPKLPADEIASATGVHWHATMKIAIKGVPYTIPANVNTDGSHVLVPHTHQADNVLHYEVQGVVRKKDLTLARFFGPWGKQLSATCLIDTCVSGTSTVKMKVNGVENTEFENYSIKDKDVIEVTLD